MKVRSNRYLAIAITVAILCAMIIGAHITNEAVNVYIQNKPVQDRTCVVIDAGHGGVDGGAVSCTGVEESKINLEIALRLNDLMHLLGIKTYMIRTEDISIYTSGETIAAKKVSDLKNRVRIINEMPNGLLISIHQNFFEDFRYSGAQVFYKEDPTFAKQLQTAFVNTLNPGSNRKVKKASGVYLMKNVTCPGALIECGFLSNFEEESKLKNEDYQKKICCVIGTVSSCYIYNQNLS